MLTSVEQKVQWKLQLLCSVIPESLPVVTFYYYLFILLFIFLAFFSDTTELRGIYTWKWLLSKVPLESFSFTMVTASLCNAEYTKTIKKGSIQRESCTITEDTSKRQYQLSQPTNFYISFAFLILTTHYLLDHSAKEDPSTWTSKISFY